MTEYLVCEIGSTTGRECTSHTAVQVAAQWSVDTKKVCLIYVLMPDGAKYFSSLNAQVPWEISRLLHGERHVVQG